jgi:hypothetical protein
VSRIKRARSAKRAGGISTLNRGVNDDEVSRVSRVSRLSRVSRVSRIGKGDT